MADKESVVFDFDKSKANYMKKIKKFFEEDSSHSEAMVKRTIEILKSGTESHLRKYYEISYLFGHEMLIEKNKSPNDGVVQVLSFEDVFDIFIKYHTMNNHVGGWHHLLEAEKNLNCTYKYPTVCLSLVVKSCNVCKARSQKPKTSNKSSVFVTVMIQKKKYPFFRYILIYIDKATDFILIRPLKHKTDIEIAMEVFKILMQIGPPQKLCLHGYNMNANKRVGNLLRQICPMFNFSIEYRSSNFDASAVVVNRLQVWMKKNVSLAWEVGCSVVQRELNMEPNQKIQDGDEDLPSHELLYGTPYLSKMDKRRQPSADQNAERTIGKDPQGNDDDVVELRIPSPDGFDHEILSQFDSENSQDPDIPLLTLDKNKDSQETEIENDSDVIFKDINDTGTDNDKLPSEGPVYVTCTKEIKKVYNEKSKLVDETLVLDMECDDDKKIEKESPPVEKMTLRSARKKDDSETETGLELEEDLIYDPEVVNPLENTVDPLDVDVIMQ